MILESNTVSIGKYPDLSLLYPYAAEHAYEVLKDFPDEPTNTVFMETRQSALALSLLFIPRCHVAMLQIHFSDSPQRQEMQVRLTDL